MRPKKPNRYFSNERKRPGERLPVIIGRRNLDYSAIEHSNNESRIEEPPKRYFTPTPNQKRQKIGLLESLVYSNNSSNQSLRSRKILKSSNTQKELNNDPKLEPLSSEGLKQIFEKYKVRIQTPLFLSKSPIIKEELFERSGEKFF